MVTADHVRSLQGDRISLRLTAAGGGDLIEGILASCLESADGLVAYVSDYRGRTHMIHYQHIAELKSLEDGPAA